MPEATWPCFDLDASRPSLQRGNLCRGVPQVRLHETAKYLYARISSSTRRPYWHQVHLPPSSKLSRTPSTATPRSLGYVKFN
ncbi:hypothetical protein ACQJBY_030983 [Aegilops geniculata]